MSKATRESAGYAYERWELYDFYERKPIEANAGTGASATSSEALVRIIGSFSVTITDVTKVQMETASKRALAEEFGVLEEAIELTVTESRRLGESFVKSRRLAGNWDVAYTVVVLAAKTQSMEAKAAALKKNNLFFEETMATALKAVGVDDSIANSVTVSSTGATPKVVSIDAAKPTAGDSNQQSDVNDTNTVLMFALIGAAVVIVLLLCTLVWLSYRHIKATRAPKDQVVGHPVNGIKITVAEKGSSDVVTFGQPVALGHPVVVSDV
jgi:hypothetical protein